MTLATLYAAHVKNEEKERDPLRLFVTDVGKCHRQVAYRMLETPKDENTPEYDENKVLMWDVAEYIEEKLWEVLAAARLGVGYQGSVNITRDNWGGRFDIIADYNGTRVIEVKTVNPNSMNKHDLPKLSHVHQVSLYHHYLHEEYELTAPPLLWYFDRASASPPEEYVIRDWAQRAGEAVGIMQEIEAVRDSLPALPDKLGKVLKERSWGKSLVREPDWRCGRKWCDYHNTCCPDMGTQEWATRKFSSAPWEPKACANRELMLQYADEQLAKALS